MKSHTNHHRLHTPLLASSLLSYFNAFRLPLPHNLSSAQHLFYRLQFNKLQFNKLYHGYHQQGLPRHSCRSLPPRHPNPFHAEDTQLFCRRDKAQATGTLSYDSAYCKFYGHTFTSNASVESIDSELSCHAILEGYLGSPEHMSSACAECFLRIRGLQDLEAARKASLESLYPFGMPSEVFLSHLYAHPTPVVATLAFWRV